MKKFRIIIALTTVFTICLGNISAISTVEAHSGTHKKHNSSKHSKSKYYYHGYKAHKHNGGYCPYK